MNNNVMKYAVILLLLLILIFIIALPILLCGPIAMMNTSIPVRDLSGSGEGGYGGSGGVIGKDCAKILIQKASGGRVSDADAEKYIELANKYAGIYGVDAPIILGIIENESHFNPKGYRYEPHINDASYGLMQTLYGTARGMGYKGTPEGLYDPETSINYGTKYISDQIKTFGTIELALGAYNGGPGAIRGGQIVYGQAKIYSKNVMKIINKYKECLESVSVSINSGEPDKCDSIRQKIVDLAKSKINSKYVYGGTGPDVFDCAGFVGYIWSEATGLKEMNHSNVPSFSKDMNYVYVKSESDLKIGDMLYRGIGGTGTFAPNTKIRGDYEHAGLYIGNGKVIQAGGNGAWDTSIEGHASGVVRMTDLIKGEWLKAGEVGRPKICF